MEENRKLIVAALVIIFGANTGSIINAYSPQVRADPFTGLEGKSIRDELEKIRLRVRAIREEQVQNTLLIKQLIKNDRHYSADH